VGPLVDGRPAGEDVCHGGICRDKFLHALSEGIEQVQHDRPPLLFHSRFHRTGRRPAPIFIPRGRASTARPGTGDS
jgi:hypothetical protein